METQISPALKQFMEEEFSFRETYVQIINNFKKYVALSDPRQAEFERLFKIFVNLPKEDKRNYFWEITWSDSFPDHYAEISQWLTPLLEHMFQTDLPFVEKYLGELMYARKFNSEFPRKCVKQLMEDLEKEHHLTHNFEYSRHQKGEEYLFTCKIVKIQQKNKQSSLSVQAPIMKRPKALKNTKLNIL